MALDAHVLHVRPIIFPVLHPHRQGRPEVPAQPPAHLVGHVLVGGGAHVAGGARGGVAVVHPHNPFAALHVQLILERVIQDAVFGLLVDFPLRVIRSQVAFAASLGLSGLALGKPVPGVARAARPQAVVGVDAADPRIGPRGRVEPASFQHFDL